MANKQSFSQIGADQTRGFVTTTGTTTAGSLKIQFNDSDDSATVMDLIERAKAQIQTYFASRG